MMKINIVFWSALLLGVLMMFYFDNHSIQQQISGLIASAAIVCLMFAYLRRVYKTERQPGQRSLGLPTTELFWSFKRKPQFERQSENQKGLNIAYARLYGYKWLFLLLMACVPFGSIILISLITSSWLPLAIFILGAFLVTCVFVREGMDRLSNQ
jgi:FtsH-binding integral membrane protein